MVIDDAAWRAAPTDSNTVCRTLLNGRRAAEHRIEAMLKMHGLYRE